MKFYLQRVVEVNLEFVLEADSLEEAEEMDGFCLDTIISIEPTTWDRVAWDVRPLDPEEEETLTYMTSDQVRRWQKVGVIPEA